MQEYFTKSLVLARPFVLAAALFALGLVPVTAQTQTTLSFRAGASIATLGGDDIPDADSRTGLNVGGGLTFGLSENLGVLVGATYAQKGATAIAEGAEITFELDYLEIPVLLQLGVPTSGSISPRFFLGPAVGAEIGCEVEGTEGGVTVSADCSDFGAPIKSVDIGAMGGAGLSMSTGGAMSITLDVFYNLGLSTIDDSSNPDDVKNRAWSILGGVSIPVGR